MEFCAIYAVSLYATVLYAQSGERAIFVLPEMTVRRFDIEDTRAFETRWN
jgi:hypothetical protein